MNNTIIEKDRKILYSLSRIIKFTKNEELRKIASDSFLYFIVDLAFEEKKDINIYVEQLQNLNFPEIEIKEFINKINKNHIEKTETQQEKKTTDLETYISENIDKDPIMAETFRKMESKLVEDLKNPNEALIKTWVNNYISFANNYKDKLDKDKLVKYMYELFNKYDSEKKYINKLSEYIIENKENSLDKKEEIKSEESKEEKPLKILNIKKSFKNKTELSVLGVSALIGLGGTVLGVPGLLTLPIAAIIWKLYKNKGLTTLKLKNFLTQNNYEIDENTKELKDKNGEIITEDKIGKSKYEMLKNYLFKLNVTKKEGKIKKEYKKNKTASTLLGSKYVDKLKIFKKKDPINEIEVEANQEIQKGMGKC